MCLGNRTSTRVLINEFHHSAEKRTARPPSYRCGPAVVKRQEKLWVKRAQIAADKSSSGGFLDGDGAAVEADCDWSVCISNRERPVSQRWWSWKATKFAPLVCNVKAISSRRFYRAQNVWNNKGESRSAPSHRCTARLPRCCMPLGHMFVCTAFRYLWLYCCHTTLEHNCWAKNAPGKMLGS